MIKRWWRIFLTTAAPEGFVRVYGAWVGYLAAVGAILFGLGALYGLFVAPADYLQGESYRIIYLHVPAASLALSCYLLLAVLGVIFLVWKIGAAYELARAVAPIGLVWAVISLVTGAIWGKPTWGAYWVWDARLTSMLILAFLYVGVLLLQGAFEDSGSRGKAAAILAIVGTINLPIIKYSVDWFNTLHQGSSLSVTGNTSIDSSMLWPLLSVIAGAYLLTMALGIYRACTFLLERHQNKRWVGRYLNQSEEV